MNIRSPYLPLIIAGLGLGACGLRLGLFALGTDSKGLLIPGHPLDLLCWLLTLAAVVLTLLQDRRTAGSAPCRESPSPAAALGAFALAAGILLTLLPTLGSFLLLDRIRDLAGLAAALALAVLGIFLWRGKAPHFLLWGILCLYLTLFAVSHYQSWCSRPQLQNYFFPMAASLLLALCAYYRTARAVGLEKPRMALATGLLAGFFSLAAAAGGEDTALYLTGGLWALTGLGPLTPVPAQAEPETQKEETP